jgi:hypothetical protein
MFNPSSLLQLPLSFAKNSAVFEPTLAAHASTGGGWTKWLGALMNSPAALISLGAFSALLILGVILRFAASSKRLNYVATSGTATLPNVVLESQAKAVARVYWEGLFEAVTSKKMMLQTSEDVRVHVTHGADSSLAPVMDQSDNGSKWGPISSHLCAIPFRPVGDHYPDTFILIEVEIPDETTLKCPVPKREMRLRWEDVNKEALFQVIPYAEGHHRFHVTLSVDEEYLTTASLSSTATVPRRYKRVATIPIDYEARLEKQAEISKRLEMSKQHDLNHQPSNEKRHEHGMSMDL